MFTSGRCVYPQACVLQLLPCVSCANCQTSSIALNRRQVNRPTFAVSTHAPQQQPFVSVCAQRVRVRTPPPCLLSAPKPHTHTSTLAVPTLSQPLRFDTLCSFG